MLKKKSYTKLLEEQGVPKVIAYKHTPKLELNFTFHKHSEFTSYDRKDIYDSDHNLVQIDTSKNYISVFG